MNFEWKDELEQYIRDEKDFADLMEDNANAWMRRCGYLRDRQQDIEDSFILGEG